MNATEPRYGIICLPGEGGGETWYVYDRQATGSTRATAMPGMRAAWREAQRLNGEGGE